MTRGDVMVAGKATSLVGCRRCRLCFRWIYYSAAFCGSGKRDLFSFTGSGYVK